MNNIRNRFTSVDYDAMLCPSPQLNLTFNYANHFTTGSCVFGAAVNTVMGRPMTSQFEVDEEQHNNPLIPGRTVILQPRHKDMGTLRFTYVKENILVGTRMRKEIEAWPEDMLYSSVKTGTDIKNSVYGRSGIYVNTIAANEEIRLSVSDYDGLV